MTPLQLFVIAITLIPLALVLVDKLRADVAALLIALTLGVGQFLGLGLLGAPDTPRDAAKALSGLSQPVVMTLFALFVVSRGLEKVGVTRWIAQRLLTLGGTSEARLVVLLTTATALLSLFMNNLAAGALLLPSAIDISRRTGISPSKLLIPVSFGSLLGGVATYFTTANIIVSDLLTAANPPQAPLGILDFTPTGGLIMLAGIAYMALIGRRLLPARNADAPKNTPSINREAAYGMERRFWELTLPPDSPFDERTLEQLAIDPADVLSVEQRRQTVNAPLPGQVVRAGNLLILVVSAERATALAAQSGGTLAAFSSEDLTAREYIFIEAIPAPHAGVAGRTLREMEFRRQTGFTPIALLREGKSRQDAVYNQRLQMGDSVLMVGPDSRLRRLLNRPEFLILNPQNVDGVTSRRRAAFVIGVTLGAIGLSVAGVPVYLAMLGAALAIILTGVLKMEEAYNTMEWQAIFLIAGMYAASQAMVNTGVAGVMGQQIVHWVEPFGGLGLAAGAYLSSALLTQIMGGQVTAFVTGPIMISAAIALGANPQAIAIATAIGCSASFITPLSHPVNLLVMGPGGYTMRDFAKVGLGLLAVCFIMLMIGMRVFWGL